MCVVETGADWPLFFCASPCVGSPTFLSRPPSTHSAFPTPTTLTLPLATATIDAALRQLLGPVGAPRVNASVVGIDSDRSTAVARVPARDAHTLRAALALCTSLPGAGGTVTLTVTHSARCMLALAADVAAFDAGRVV